jgi:hypothetical protein
MAILRPPDYRPGVYIMAGDSLATAGSVEQIDLSAPAPAWTAIADLNRARDQQCTATLLPDGRIHIAGGLGGADGGPCDSSTRATPSPGGSSDPP